MQFHLEESIQSAPLAVERSLVIQRTTKAMESEEGSKASENAMKATKTTKATQAEGSQLAQAEGPQPAQAEGSQPTEGPQPAEAPSTWVCMASIIPGAKPKKRPLRVELRAKAKARMSLASGIAFARIHMQTLSEQHSEDEDLAD